MFTKKKLIAVVASALIVSASLLALSGCGNSNVAAIVNGRTITEDEVTQYTEDFRQTNGYTSDVSWSLYYGQENLTTKTWRESAIRHLAEDILIRQKADDLGISVRSDEVDQRIAKIQEAYGIASNDGEAWTDLLAKMNTTPDKFRSVYELSDLEQQVISAEGDVNDAANDEACQNYIENNLMNIVTRRYSVISFDKSDKAKAKKTLSGLKKLKGNALKEAFNKITDEQSAECSLASGDLGWNIAYDISKVDSKGKLSKLQNGDLHDGLIKNGDYLQIYLCTGRYVFGSDVKYSKIKDSSLQDTLQSLTLSSQWEEIASDYLTQLVDSADVQVREMPSGLSYDLQPTTSYEEASNLYGNNEDDQKE